MMSRICVVACVVAILGAGSVANASNKASRGGKPRVSDAASKSREKFVDGKASKVESVEDELTKSKTSQKKSLAKAKSKAEESDLKSLVSRMEAALKRADERADTRTFQVLSSSSVSQSGVAALLALRSCSSSSNLNAWLVVRRSTSVVPVTTYSTVSTPVVSGYATNGAAAFGGVSYATGVPINAVAGAGSYGNAVGTRLVTRSPYQTIHYRGAVPTFVSPSRSYPYMTFTGATQFTTAGTGDGFSTGCNSAPGVSSPGMIIIQP